MTTNSVIVGSHFWFFRENDAFTVPAPGVCGQESKPGISPTLDAGWILVGTVEDFTPDVTQTDAKLYMPAPGRLVLKDILETKQELSGKITLNDVSALAIESAFRSSQELQGAQKQFNPLSAVSRRGWAHFQCYDENDALFLTLDFWVKMRTKMAFKMEPVKPEIDIFMLYSSQNTGAIV